MPSYFTGPIRYRSEGGAIVTVENLYAECAGCGAENYSDYSNRRKWAEKHAEKCRALPRR
ncbi:hypothetical protein OHU17_18675 [Streptomyces goshikiensis]|uniref:Uncharacterized protein n=1 Tax=Streptomyces goshikiensis TaxID=1942 RepID=A0ABZ1RM37_9ACTN|nr:hypothetical protein [Streptomyces goshikiensis]GHD59304.1 hypothetical protein GCM10010336_09780 [Streptomyces goshikiensis]